MNNHRYDSYCGIYCGACGVLNAESEQDKEGVARTWNSASNLENRITPNQVHCMGCKTNALFIGCANCKMRDCAQQKKVEFCIECDDYPCGIYEEFIGNFEWAPHIKVTIANLKYIKKNGVERWLVDQKARWACPQCKTNFTWYTQECKKCKTDLKGLKDYENLTDQDLII